MMTLLVSLLACTGKDAPATESGEHSPAVIPGLDVGDLSGKNLVYLHVDTFRRDHMPMYGYPRDTLPLVGGRPWLVVDGLHAGSSWTMPSTAALLSADPPDINGLTDFDDPAGSELYTIRVPTVTEHLHDLGWATALYTGNVWLTHMTDMDKGFDVATMQKKDQSRYNLDTLLDPALEWLATVPTDQRFLLFLQPMDMHQPYWVAPEDRGYWGEGEPPFDLEEPDDHVQARGIGTAIAADPVGATQALNDVYDEEMIGLDRGIDRLLRWLEDEGRLDDTVVVFSADHGEMLNDAGDGNIGHGNELLEQLVANPFLVLVPGAVGGAVDCVARNEDVFPTLLEAMDLPALEGVDGVSLSGACQPFAVSQLWADSTHLQSISVSDGRVRLERTCTTGAEVAYDLVADPTQVVPLGASDIEGGAAMAHAIGEAATRIAAGWPGNDCGS